MASPEEMEAAMVANIETKTGKSLEAWLELARSSSLEKHGEIVKHLKSEHGLTHGYANLVAHRHRRGDATSPSQMELVDAQYTGAKATLRPIYDAVIALASSMGKDVEIAPKKSYVSLRRNKQFGLVQASTKTRVDLGLNIKDAEATDRLELSGSFNSMVSHRVRLTSADQVDAELKRWMKQAFGGA